MLRRLAAGTDAHVEADDDGTLPAAGHRHIA
jgi:hypothetical protein